MMLFNYQDKYLTPVTVDNARLTGQDELKVWHRNNFIALSFLL